MGVKQPPRWLLEARRQREERARAAWSRIRAARPDYGSLRPPLELAAGPDLVLVVSHHPDGSGAVRITRFTPDGPLSHHVLADADAAIEHAIHHDRIDGELVPGRVDEWSLTDRWARGIDALRAISDFNRAQAAGCP